MFDQCKNVNKNRNENKKINILVINNVKNITNSDMDKMMMREKILMQEVIKEPKKGKNKQVIQIFRENENQNSMKNFEIVGGSN